MKGLTGWEVASCQACVVQVSFFFARSLSCWLACSISLLTARYMCMHVVTRLLIPVSIVDSTLCEMLCSQKKLNVVVKCYLDCGMQAA